LNAKASESIESMFSTRLVFHFGPNGRLNEAAASNLSAIVTTLLVSQLSGWLNEVASSKTLAMLVTFEVSHPPIGWSNADASSNMSVMSTSSLVSHPEMSLLNSGEFLNAATAESNTGTVSGT